MKSLVEMQKTVDLVSSPLENSGADEKRPKLNFKLLQSIQHDLPADGTFKFTKSFRAIPVANQHPETKVGGWKLLVRRFFLLYSFPKRFVRSFTNSLPLAPSTRHQVHHLKESVDDLGDIKNFLNQSQNPSINKNASFSMKEFDRICRNYSDHAASPQKHYLTKSSELNLVPQPILVSHLWGVESDIDLTGRGLYSDYVAAFSETLKDGLRPGVHTIRMGKNRIDDEAASLLFDALIAGNCELEILVLRENRISNGSMDKFSHFLKLGHLIELDLSNNDLKGSGIETLCGGIAEQSTLLSLNLNGNEVGETGAFALAQLLASEKGCSCSLTSLGLAWTELSGLHGAALLAGLAKVRSTCVIALPLE